MTPLATLEVFHHLLRIGALPADACLDEPIVIREILQRNVAHRVERPDGSLFVKQPTDDASSRGQAAWMEATLYWLAANDPAFAPLRRFLPRFVHYDMPRRVLVLELVEHAVDLHAHAHRSSRAPAAVLAHVGEAFALLHGPIAARVRQSRGRALFRPMPPWLLTLLDVSACTFQARTRAGAEMLAHVRRTSALAAPLDVIARLWSPRTIVHGDTKWTNVLVVSTPGGSDETKVIDWELAGIGDPAWDLAGFACGAAAFAATRAPGVQPTAAEIAAGFMPLWNRYVEVASFDALAARTMLELTIRFLGARLVQFCLESVDQRGGVDSHVPSLLDLAVWALDRPGAVAAALVDV